MSRSLLVSLVCLLICASTITPALASQAQGAHDQRRVVVFRHLRLGEMSLGMILHNVDLDWSDSIEQRIEGFFGTAGLGGFRGRGLVAAIVDRPSDLAPLSSPQDPSLIVVNLNGVEDITVWLWQRWLDETEYRLTEPFSQGVTLYLGWILTDFLPPRFDGPDSEEDQDPRRVAAILHLLYPDQADVLNLAHDIAAYLEGPRGEPATFAEFLLSAAAQGEERRGEALQVWEDGELPPEVAFWTGGSFDWQSQWHHPYQLTDDAVIEVACNYRRLQLSKAETVLRAGDLYLPLSKIIRALPGLKQRYQDDGSVAVDDGWSGRSIVIPRPPERGEPHYWYTVDQELKLVHPAPLTNDSGELLVPLYFIAAALGAGIDLNPVTGLVDILWPVKQPSLSPWPGVNHSEGSQGERVVGARDAYLTFDDGPTRGTTDRILEILADAEVKATFFPIAERILYYPSLAWQVVRGGHTIGNHSYDHRADVIYRSPQAFIESLEMANKVFERILGLSTRIVRPPGGSGSHFTEDYWDAVASAGYRVFDWTISSADSAYPRPPAGRILDRIADAVVRDRGGRHPIILMHDGPVHDTTIEALPLVIQFLKERGFNLSGLDSLVGP